MVTPTEVDALKAKVRGDVIEIIKSGVNTLGYLRDRWRDEKEYEDFAEYEKAMKKLVPAKSELKFVKASKAPFGFRVRHPKISRDILIYISRDTANFKMVG